MQVFDKSFGIIYIFMLVFFLLLISNWYCVSFGSFAYKMILSISVSWFIRLSNAFVYPDPEHPIINVLYIWSGISDQSGLFSFMSSVLI